MSADQSDNQRISIRNVEPGMELRYAYDDQDKLITGDVKISNQIDVQRLESLGVRYVVIDEERGGSKLDSNSAETLTSSVLDWELEEEPDLLRKSEKTYEKLVNHMRQVFQEYHEGEANLDELYELVPYLKKFIEFVDESPASVSILTQIENYDSVTYNHSINVSILGILYGRYREFSRDELLELAFGCLVHDVGKMEVPRSIINKDGRLSEEEFEKIREHPREGNRLLREEGIDGVHARMTLEHHERPDGSGYPRGTEEIHYYSSILSVLDVYEAMTAPRSYKSAKIPLKAYRVLKNEFFPFADTRHIVDGLIHCLGVFPVGSLVRLTDDSAAVVQKNNTDDLTRPVVSVVADAEGNVLSNPYMVDLHHVYQQKKIAHDHFYDDDTAIKSMILPGSRSEIKEKINRVYDGLGDKVGHRSIYSKT
jgi:HD-GYP domain-containing protein (c-di-GMP phosphodiesterase class II)